MLYQSQVFSNPEKNFNLRAIKIIVFPFKVITLDSNSFNSLLLIEPLNARVFPQKCDSPEKFVSLQKKSHPRKLCRPRKKSLHPISCRSLENWKIFLRSIRLCYQNSSLIRQYSEKC